MFLLLPLQTGGGSRECRYKGETMKVLNFGSLNLDYVYKVDHMVARGETETCHARNTYYGGKGLNQSVALSRAGAPVYHAGNVGSAGLVLLRELENAGVNTGYVKVLEDVPTGHTVIQNDREGDNCILLFSGANRCVTPEQVDEVFRGFSAGDWIILQNEINALALIMAKAREKGMVLVFNPSPADERLRDLPLGDVDWFVLNEIEAGQLTGVSSENPEELLAALHARFPGAKIVLTLGSDGSMYSDGQTVLRQGIYKTAAVDTTAAGDTFTGYFIAGIIQGDSPAEALNRATMASSICVSREGAAPSIPALHEVQSALSAISK